MPVALLAFENDDLTREVEAALSQTSVRVVKGGAGVELLDLLAASPPEVVLLEPPGSGSLAQTIRSIQAAAPEAPVVVVHRKASAEAVLESIRAGASDCLYPPFASEAPTAIERVLRERMARKPSSAGKVVAFLSAKGGCGATTIACHVAPALRAQGAQPVLLADLDLGAGMIAFLLKTSNRHTILDAVHNIERLDGSFWKALVSVSAGVDVITAPGPAAVQAETARFASVLRFARSTYKWSVVDLGRGLNWLTAALLAEIDELWIVTTPDPLAREQTKRLAGYLAEAGGPRVRLVVNRVPCRTDFDEADWEKSFGLPVAAILRDSEAELLQAVEQGALVSARTGLGKDFALLARTLALADGESSPAAARQRSSGLVARSHALSAAVKAKLLRAPAETVTEINWTSYIELSETAFRLGRTTEALLFLNKAAGELEGNGKAEARLGRTLNRLGVTLAHAGHWAEAERSLKRARGLLERELGESHPELAVCLSNLAAVFKATGQTQRALELYVQSLAICEAKLGPWDAAVAWNLDGIAEIQGIEGQGLSALFAFQRSLAIKKQVLGDGHWDVAVTLEKIGELYMRQARYTEAEPLFWRSAAIRKRILGELAPGLAKSYSRLARLYLAQKKFHDANRLFRFTLALLASKADSDRQAIRTNLAQLAESYQGMGQFTQASATSELAEAFLHGGEDRRRRVEDMFLPELQHAPQPSAGVEARWAHADLY